MYEEYYGMAVNGYDDVVGYAVDTDTTPHPTDGVLWWFQGNDTWSPTILDQDNPDPVDSTLSDVADKADGTVDIVGSYWTATGPNGAFYVTLDSGGDYWSYSLDPVSSGGNQHDSFVLYPLRIRREVEDNFWAPQTHTANGINAIGTIAGSYREGEPSIVSVRPCLFVANDMDNNGKPDFREILQARLASVTTDPDQNGNWMLDWAENDQNEGQAAQNMRIGLHSPGLKVDNLNTDDIDYVQIIRLGAKLTFDCESATSDLDILATIDFDGEEQDPCEQCGDNFDNFEAWCDPEGDNQREVIVRILTPLECSDPDHDYLPESAQDRGDLLIAMRIFAYRYAGVIDYIQLGNESFTGAQNFAFRPNEIPGWQTGGTFDEVPYGLVDEAVELVLEWHAEIANAVREGSSLAGHPMRLVTPAHPMGSINTGYSGDFSDGIDNDADAIAYAINATCIFGNRERACFDLHAHYEATAGSDVGPVIDKLLDDTNAPWSANLPQGLMALEWGPKGDLGVNWVSQNSQTAHQFCEPDGDITPYESWDEFVRAWEDAQFGNQPGQGFRLDVVLDEFIDNGFVAACYGPSKMHAMNRDGNGNLDQDGPDVWDLAALWAQEVLTGNDDPYGFSVLKDDYESAAASRIIGDFEPKPLPLDKNRACPECGF